MIRPDLGKIIGEVAANKNRIPARLAAKQRDHLFNDLIYVQRLLLRSTLLEEQADPVDDFSGAGYIFDDSAGCFASLCDVGLIASKPAQTGIGVGKRGGNGLSDLGW